MRVDPETMPSAEEVTASLKERIERGENFAELAVQTGMGKRRLLLEQLANESKLVVISGKPLQRQWLQGLEEFGMGESVLWSPDWARIHEEECAKEIRELGVDYFIAEEPRGVMTCEALRRLGRECGMVIVVGMAWDLGFRDPETVFRRYFNMAKVLDLGIGGGFRAFQNPEAGNRFKDATFLLTGVGPNPNGF